MSISTLDSQAPSRLKKSKANVSSKLSSSIQRLSRNTACSIARMKGNKAGEDEIKENRKSVKHRRSISTRKHPKAESSSVLGQHDQPPDLVGDFVNQTDFQEQSIETSAESRRSACMACNRHISRKSSTCSQAENLQLLPSTPSSPIPTYHGPPKANAEEDESTLGWDSQFTTLTNILIRHSETLEQVSLDLLKSENRVRALLESEHELEDKYAVQEEVYEQELLEYNTTLKKQQVLLNSLDEFIRDIRAKQEPADDALTPPPKATQSNIAARLRWQIYQMIGGSAGTGQVIQDASCIVVTGTGVLIDQEAPTYHDFALYLNPATMETKYQRRLECNWVPDTEIGQCQYVTGAQTAHPQLCHVKFGWYQRRHHCRR
ncbi:hypothetical protein BC943DRAFT_363245 [Umbelopsis sp. AD052]|nr:hypothetical protein BC943DRAFT_363245 [Umbelopsis sp. AD052]